MFTTFILFIFQRDKAFNFF